MKIIDLLNKIANGEIDESTIIEFDNGYKDYCSVRVFFDRYIMDKENLNLEIKLKEDEIIHVEMNEEDVQNLVNCYEKDIKYIKKLEQELERYKNIIDELERYFIDMFNRTQDTKYLDDLQKLKELKGE